VARDRPLATVADVDAAAARGEAINLKAPRMGGPLVVLRALAAARSRGALVYFGGMFEVGPGREQARQLAALFCGEAPNDLGPLLGALAPAGAPSLMRLDAAGFGATCDWLRRERRRSPGSSLRRPRAAPGRSPRRAR
jgi:hypothetical protein